MDGTCNKLVDGFDPKHNVRCSGPLDHDGPCTNHPCFWQCRTAGVCLELGNGCAWQKEWKK